MEIVAFLAVLLLLGVAVALYGWIFTIFKPISWAKRGAAFGFFLGMLFAAISIIGPIVLSGPKWLAAGMALPSMFTILAVGGVTRLLNPAGDHLVAGIFIFFFVLGAILQSAFLAAIGAGLANFLGSFFRKI